MEKKKAASPNPGSTILVIDALSDHHKRGIHGVIYTPTVWSGNVFAAALVLPMMPAVPATLVIKLQSVSKA